VGTSSPFERGKYVFWFVAAAVSSCAVASTIGVTALFLAGIVPASIYGPAWLTWWLGDTAGMLVLAPAIYCWFRMPGWSYSKARLVELIGLIVVTITMDELLFGGWFRSEIANSLPYLIVPGLVWAAFRFGPRETSTIAALSAVIAIVNTWQHMNGVQAAQQGAAV